MVASRRTNLRWSGWTGREPAPRTAATAGSGALTCGTPMKTACFEAGRLAAKNQQQEALAVLVLVLGEGGVLFEPVEGQSRS